MDVLERLRARRAALKSEARQLYEQTEARALTPQEEQRVDQLKDELETLEARIEEIQEGDRREAEIERDRAPWAQALRRQGSGPSDRFVMPTMAEYRALGEGTGAGGGFLVPDMQARQIYDMLRAQSVLLQSGPVVVDMVSDVLTLPKVASGTSVGMYNENQLIAASDPSFAQVTLTARKAGAITLASREVLEDSTPSIREVLGRDHMQQIALYLDSQFLGIAGNGTAPNMRGIREFTGATVTNLAAAVTLDHVADALERLETANAGSRPAIFAHRRDWANLRTQKDTQNRYQLQPDPTSEARRQLFGVPVFISNQIPVNLGAGTNQSWILVVDLNQIVVGRRREIELSYSEHYAYAKRPDRGQDHGTVRHSAAQRRGRADPGAGEPVNGQARTAEAA